MKTKKARNASECTIHTLQVHFDLTTFALPAGINLNKQIADVNVNRLYILREYYLVYYFQPNEKHMPAVNDRTRCKTAHDHPDRMLTL